jgi:hypothetical protein
MNVIPEIVKVEMAYRREQALAGVELEHVRAARARRTPWWRRMFTRRVDRPPTSKNQVKTRCVSPAEVCEHAGCGASRNRYRPGGA